MTDPQGQPTPTTNRMPKMIKTTMVTDLYWVGAKLSRKRILQRRGLFHAADEVVRVVAKEESA